jgi:hypothetical protein
LNHLHAGAYKYLHPFPPQSACSETCNIAAVATSLSSRGLLQSLILATDAASVNQFFRRS